MSDASAASEFDLYLDESGSFMETSTDPEERARDDEENKRRFPSQLAGLLVPRGGLTEEKAFEILEHCHAAAGWPLPGVVHLNRYWQEPSYFQDQKNFDTRLNSLVADLLEQLSANRFQPVRLVNIEGVNFGTKERYYTNMVAELFIRLCRQKQREGIKRVSIHLTCAEVLLTVPVKRLLSRNEYKLRLREHIAMAAVRRGFAADSCGWELASLDLSDANASRRLQLCDAVSYASHDDFRRISRTTRQRFRKALGEYDWTLQLRELLERVWQLREEGSLGPSMLTLVEGFVRGEVSQALLAEAEAEKKKVLDELAAVVAPVRDSQLAVILSWLEQMITLQRATERGYKIACWLRRGVEAELRVRLAETGRADELDWFSFALNYWALTASNHEGSLRSAREAARELYKLTASLAGQWERTPLLMEGLVALAVHETDCLEFADASARMELVVAHYDELAKLFPSVMPNMFSTPVRSDLKAKALGTWLQSEILAGVGRAGRAEGARLISDRAIEEFCNRDDKERQYQYRSQLECSAGDFSAAREYLARSLRLKDFSHDSIAEAITKFGGNKVAQGFALLHWLRIGALGLLAGDADEFSAFLSSFERSGLLRGTWCGGDETVYPAHGILRRLAVIHAGAGRPDESLAALDRLGELTRLSAGQLTLRAILLAGQAEVAVVLWGREGFQVIPLLDSGGKGRPGIRQLADSLKNEAREFPAISEFAAQCLSVVEELTRGEVEEDAGRRVLEIGCRIGY